MVIIKVLELFSGTQSISKEFRKAGHETFTIDFNEIFKSPEYEDTDLIMDIFDVTPELILEKFGRPDVIWASVPCQRFSVASIGRHWIKGTNTPKTEEAKQAVKLVKHVLHIIEELNPKYYFIENPRGKLRKLDFMQKLPRYTTTYCLRGDTKIITKEGNFPIGDLCDKTVTLLTSGGNWINAPIRDYGKQELMKITLSRAGKKKIIYATPNHKWMVKNKEIETRYLKPKKRLDYTRLKPAKSLGIINEYVARGFTFGDGWNLKDSKKGYAMFCDEKQEILPYFDGVGNKRWDDSTETCSIIKLYGTPREWKTTTPSIYEQPSKIFSWLAGYIASDGTVGKNNGQVSISSSKKENLEAVRTLCRVIGIDTYGITEYLRKGYGKIKTPIYQVTLMRSDVPREMILRSKHIESFDKAGTPKHQARKWSVVSVEKTDIIEDVYCAEVPNTHTFTLEDGILTHNCQYGDARMKPTDLWCNHPNPKFKPPCKNGDPCHVSAPRGSRTGTQGLKNAIERARIPQELCKHIVNICEEE